VRCSINDGILEEEELEIAMNQLVRRSHSALSSTHQSARSTQHCHVQIKAELNPGDNLG
jgi:hypothetical protein